MRVRSKLDVQLQPKDTAMLDTVLLDTAKMKFETERFSKVAMRTYGRIAEAWKLSNVDAAPLIGLSLRTWDRIKTEDWDGKLEPEQLMRISAVIGLYEALHCYFSESIANQWVSIENAGQSFGGHKPITVMLDGGYPAIVKIRNYIEALLCGM